MRRLGPALDRSTRACQDHPVCAASLEFVPLTTKQGHHPRDLVEALRGRSLVIWGAGHMGRALAGVFRSAGATQMFFCDRRADMVGRQIDGILVKSPEGALEDAKAGCAFIVIAVAQAASAITKQAESHGLRNGHDFISFRKVSRPEAVIQVLGPGSHAQMSFGDFKAIIDKISHELPHLYQVEITGVPDVLLHSDLPRLIEVAREHTACLVTTTVSGVHDESFAPVLRSRPSCVVLKTHGFDDPEAFRRAVACIAALRDAGADGGATELRVNFVRRRTDSPGAIRAARDICGANGVVLVVSEMYVEPYDRTLAYCCGRADDETHKDIESLSWGLDDALTFAREDRAMPCLCQRIFPVINIDRSVGLCHLYEKPRIALDFLDQSYDRLLALRHDAAHCRTCQTHALHRLDIDVLRDRHQSLRSSTVE